MRDIEKLRRVVIWFNKMGDDFAVDKEDITCLAPSFLIKLLNIDVGDDDEMVVGDYLISDEDVLKLQPYMQHKIDTKRYEYFIGTYA